MYPTKLGVSKDEEGKPRPSTAGTPNSPLGWLQGCEREQDKLMGKEGSLLSLLSLEHGEISSLLSDQSKSATN